MAAAEGSDAQPILIDALNVAYWCGDPPSLRLPMSLMVHLLAAGHPVLSYFDASARYRLNGEAAVYQQLAQHSAWFIEAPAGRAADALMLRHARSSGASIVSRDRYRDHRRRYRKLIDDPSRLIAGTVENDRLLLPALALAAPLAASAEQAWELLESFLPGR